MRTTRDIRERIDLSKGLSTFAILLMIIMIVIYCRKGPEQTSTPTSQIEIGK